MRKIKKALALSLAMAMGLSLVACGGNDDATTEATTEAKTEATEAASDDATEATEADASATGAIAAPSTDGWDDSKKIYAYSWDEDFSKKMNVVLDKFPEYKDYVEFVTLGVGGTTDEYKTAIDTALTSGDKYPSLIPADNDVAKYWSEDDTKTANLTDLGFTDDVMANSYDFAKQYGTYNGELKAVTWQATAGSVFYRRDIAKEVLGTDDPAEVQKSVADWDKFADTAKMMAAKNYKMTSSVNDTYRVFSNNVTSKWVDENNVINVDDNIKKWVDMSKAMVDAKQTDTHALWSDDWAKGFYETGNVFCYFGPAWLIDFSMHCDEKGSVGYDGGWAVTEGPQGFFWGGTWICTAAGTDNQELVKDLMLCLTTDEETMTQIVEKDHDFVNNSKVMEAKATGSSFGDKYLSNQNPVGLFCNGIKTVSLANISGYDQGCNEEFQNAMKDYFDGNYKTYEDALDAFYTKVIVKYPELKKPE